MANVNKFLHEHHIHVRVGNSIYTITQDTFTDIHDLIVQLVQVSSFEFSKELKNGKK